MDRPSELDHAEQLAALYATRSTGQIAEMLGVSSTTVLRALVRHNIARRGRGDTARTRITNPELADRDWLAETYRTSTITAIAEAVGVDHATVRRALKIHGIELHRREAIPRADRPSQLDDPIWLTRRYERAWSIREVADELGVNEQMVGAALRRHGIPVRSERGSEHPLLNDSEWLVRRVEEIGTAGVANELDVSQVGVQAALRRHGHHSPHRFDCRSIERPARRALLAVWNIEETIKGVARHFGVSHTTSAIWLAEIGIFVNDVPAISKRDLERCVTEGRRIADIVSELRVTGRTVIVELHRHELFDRHRRRHMR